MHGLSEIKAMNNPQPRDNCGRCGKDLKALREAARAVVDNWGRGQGPRAVRALAALLPEAEGN